MAWSVLAIASSLLAVALGVWHHRMAVRAIFVFSEGEAWTTWLTVLCGPMATLPAALLSFYQREAAGYLLIFGTVVSFGSFLLEAQEVGQHLPGLLMNIYGPMFAIGIAFVFLSRQRERVSDSTWGKINGPQSD